MKAMGCKGKGGPGGKNLGAGESRRRKRLKGAGRLAAMLLLGLLLLGLTGCGKSQAGIRLVLTTGFKKNEVFRIESMSCTLPEVMVYLVNTKEQYESVYGEKIWETSLNGVTLEESIKDTVLAQLAQVKTMNLLAGQYDVALNEEERQKVKEAAAAYFGSLNQAEREAMQATEDIIENLYTEFALANKVYEYIIKDINPEISDDEARTITVRYIFIRTCSVDSAGVKTQYSPEEKAKARALAEEILGLAREEGSDFEELVLTYSEGEKNTYSFGKGETEKIFEDAAFNLGTDEVSGLIETENGYYIIKCISTFNREETDANKVKIVEKRRREVFGQEYDVFVASLTRTLNEELWAKVSFVEDDEIETKDFFDIYNQYFS
ncbi:foldase protein PrsA 1 [Lachnospiraceae bacterium]|nr:foldase protein PrsA 1 [Lachnospiraceae bacterium]